MSKKYLISVNEHLSDDEKENLLKAFGDLKVEVKTHFHELNVFHAEIPDQKTADQLRKLHGIIAVEDDKPMKMF